MCSHQIGTLYSYLRGVARHVSPNPLPMPSFGASKPSDLGVALLWLKRPPHSSCNQMHRYFGHTLYDSKTGSPREHILWFSDSTCVIPVRHVLRFTRHSILWFQGSMWFDSMPNAKSRQSEFECTHRLPCLAKGSYLFRMKCVASCNPFQPILPNHEIILHQHWTKISQNKKYE